MRYLTTPSTYALCGLGRARTLKQSAFISLAAVLSGTSNGLCGGGELAIKSTERRDSLE